MEDAGLTVRRDAVGNVIGRVGAGPPLVLGSHIDTVPDAGPVRRPARRARRARRRRAGRGSTETARRSRSSRSPTRRARASGPSYLGSAAYTGGFDPAWLDLVDGERDHARRRDPRCGRRPRRPPSAPAPELAGYVEVHIEQGPVLEREGLPVGVVTAIAGQTRAQDRAQRARRVTRGRCPWTPAATRSPPPPRWCSRSSSVGRGEDGPGRDGRARCRSRRTSGTSSRARCGCCWTCATRTTDVRRRRADSDSRRGGADRGGARRRRRVDAAL